MRDIIIVFLVNLIASFCAVLLALWVNRRWKKQSSEEITKLKLSLKYYIKKYGKREDET